MMNYKVRAIPASEFPAELMEQKRDYNRDEFMKLAANPGAMMYTYVIEDDDGVVCAFWCHSNKIYNSIFIDTFVVADKHRTPDVVRRCVEVAYAILEPLGEKLGVDKVCFGMYPPLAEKFLKYCDSRASITEWLITVDMSKDVDGKDKAQEEE